MADIWTGQSPALSHGFLRRLRKFAIAALLAPALLSAAMILALTVTAFAMLGFEAGEISVATVTYGPVAGAVVLLGIVTAALGIPVLWARQLRTARAWATAGAFFGVIAGLAVDTALIGRVEPVIPLLAAFAGMALFFLVRLISGVADRDFFR